MEHRPLGRTGVSVSKLCLGAMMFGDWGTKDHDQSIRIIHSALDAGINFIDTADIYSQGESEVIVGKALAGGRRDDVVLATKVWGAMGEDVNRRGASRRWIIGEVEDSLARLGTDWIDLYQIHRYEPDTDIEETLGALSDLVYQGKVRYIGSSTFPPSAIVEAQWVASARRDGTLGNPRTIWVVRVGGDLYVRSMYGRGGGWFPGTQVRHQGHIRAGGVDKEVTFTDADPDLNDQIDAAYRDKYRRSGDRIIGGVVNPGARAATIKLMPR
jgi:aryl-alcohol dehydrogenase-like predicted oxidoreductase